MAYRIKRKERVGTGIRRILRQQLGRAVEAARDRDGVQEERVHEVRTRLKRSRAALELIGAGRARAPSVNKKTDRRLRDLGRRLARPRDIVVQAQTFRILGTRLSRELPAGLLERVRDVGEQLRRQAGRKIRGEGAAPHGPGAAAAAPAAAQVPGQARPARDREGDHAHVPPARRALADVHADPTPERFHEWRKRVKLLSNELKIIGRAVPELATRYALKVEKLGEILGQVHDLDCAAATTARHPRWFGSDADCEAVRGLVAEHRVVLEREAFALATGVFAGRARDVRELVETRLEDVAHARTAGRRGR